KAIGHESQIEPWLALTTTLLDASETDERRFASKMNLENWENRRSSYQYMGWMSERISLRPPVAGEVFFLDIPFYRTMLPKGLDKTQENRLTWLEMKANRLSRLYPDWRRDGARKDDLAGAKRLAKMRKQSGYVTNDVHQFSRQHLKVRSVGQFLPVANDAPAQ